jgi:signal transduction histidine kinase
MKWQFIRFYIGIAIVLLCAAGVFFVSVQRDFERQMDERYERFMTPWVEKVREKLAGSSGDLDERAGLIGEIESRPRSSSRHEKSRRGPPPTRLVARADVDLPDDAAERLDAGEVVSVRDGDRRLVYATVEGGAVMIIESIPWRGRDGKDRDGRDGRDRDDGATTAILYLLAPPLGILMLIGIAVFLLIRPIERRISSLTDATRRFGAGALDTRAQVGRTGTVDELEESFNAMAARIADLIGGQRELLRAVSHDLRTPLARVFFALDDAQTAATVEEKNRHLERIDRSLVELNGLVEELTDYLQLGEGGVAPAKEWIDLKPVISHAADLVSDLHKDAVFDATCVDLEVFAEPRYLKRAVDNLVTNAITYGRGGVWITCLAEGGALHFSVDDDGPGIPEDERDRVFEPFYRREQSRNMDLGGSGLGLAIVARIMAWHGGSVEISDSPRGGARFTLVFPGEGGGTETA